MITQVNIKNFKCLRDVTVNLERFTVFVGANGSGKTSILQAVDLLCRRFRSGMERLDSELLQHRSFGVTEEVELSCLYDRRHYRWTATTTTFSVEGLLDWKPWEPQQTKLPSPVWLNLDPNVLRNKVENQNIRRMENNGVVMHRALSSMMLERRSDFFKLEADLSRIVPSVKQLQPTAEHEIRFDTINGKRLTAHQVSEGTLLTLGLLTAIHCMDKPGILLLDDLDRALHPIALQELIDLLRGVQTTNPDIQIIGSTHSPYMLDRMQPKEVQVISLREDGSTVCEPLTKRPKFEKWKHEFQSGELWSYFGEKWVQPESTNGADNRDKSVSGVAAE